MKESIEPEKIDAQTVSAILAGVSVKDIIRNDTMCAAFHRFLVLNFAEENLLFIGAVELFKLGQWKGMKELGEESGLIPVRLLHCNLIVISVIILERRRIMKPSIRFKSS